jgi:aminoglycoside phosphotransferase (APT) family kinase protein
VSDLPELDLHDQDPELSRWIESSLGGRILRSHRTAVGGSRTTYLIDVERDDGIDAVVARCEGQGSFTGSELTLAREATAYRALAATPVPSPAVLAQRADGSCVILERLEGTHDLDALDEVERATAMDDFIQVLARLHLLDPDELDLPGFPRPTSAEDHARLDISMWQRLAAEVVDLDPLLAFCGSWLHRSAPETVARTSFVQGDTGPGNFLVHEGRVSGLVDLEFAHLGDPMDDLAWLLMRMRAERHEADDLFRRYEQVSGITIDEESVRYYRLAVDYRCAITTSLAVTRGGGARGFAPYLMVTHRYLDGVARRIGALTGVEDDQTEVSVEPTPQGPLFDQLLADVRTAVKSIEDHEVRERTRNAQIFVHYLRAHDRYGETIAELDRRDRAVSLGDDIGEAELVDIATKAGERADLAVLAYLIRRQHRRDALWQTLQR